MVNAVLNGKRNLENAKKRAGEKPMRLPVTINMLKYIKIELTNSDKSKHDKHLLWATTIICFSGGLRCGEVICEKPGKFDPDTTLLQRDIKLRSIEVQGNQTQILQLTLKSEKQNRSGTPTILDIYPSNSSICPIKAFKRWQDEKSTEIPNLPAFRWENGENLTKRTFNKFLKDICAPLLQGRNGYISGHSLRIGLASLLGSMGFSDQEIMASGRWSSRAFQDYLKLPRTRRLEMARAISRL